jgi:hypothetical protein
MKFQKGQSGNPAGRPKGAFRATSVLAQQLLTADAEDIIRKTIEQAKEGQSAAMRICWDRIAPLPIEEEEAEESFPYQLKWEYDKAKAFISKMIKASRCGDLTARKGSWVEVLFEAWARDDQEEDAPQGEGT